MSRSISEWQNYIVDWANRKGWDFDYSQTPEKLMLMVTEISEAMEEYRKGHSATYIYHGGESAPIPGTQRGFISKPEGFPIELADLAIRLMHFCGRMGIDLDAMIEQKMQYNEAREFRHGGKLA